MTITTNIKTFSAGDSINWEIQNSEFLPSANYNCTVILINATSTKIEWLCTNDIENEKFVLQKLNTDTENLEANKYKMFLVFSKSSDDFVKQYEFSDFEIKPNITESLNLDSRTDNQKKLEAVRALIHGRLFEGVQSFAFNGRSITLMTMTELMNLEKYLEVKVSAELGLSDIGKKGRTNRNRLKVKYLGVRY